MMMKSKKKEVYFAYGLDEELLYIGQGNIGRNNHCLNGCSHNKGLNRYYFQNGEGGSIRAEVYKYYDCEEQAISDEISLIKELKPLFNSVFSEPKPFTDRVDTDKKQNFRELSEEYYKIHNEIKVCEDNLIKTQLKKELDLLKSLDRDFSDIVNTIGIDEIKKTSFHKTKSKVKCKRKEGISKIAKSKTPALGKLRVRLGAFYTYLELKKILQECYDNNGIQATAKATDIKEIYKVSRTTRQGIEGFLVVSKL